MSSFKPKLLASTIAMALLPGLLQAQILDEITVTAQKREQSVQDVGIAMSAFSGEQMEQLGFSNAQQVTSMAPGVSTVQPNGEANYALAIRGVASSDFTTNVESPVAMYLDEVYISQMSGAGFQLYDMERVEILRGPQGTLFGRNATGGLAHFISNKPSQDFSGYVKGTIGDYDQYKAEGAIGGGITDTLAARFSGAYVKSDGYVRNRYTGTDLNNADDQSYRLQFLWDPTEDLQILLSGRKSEQEIDSGFFENVTSLIPGKLTPPRFNPILNGYRDHDGNPYGGDYDRDGFNDLDTDGLTLTLKWQIGDLNLTSISDRSNVHRHYIEDSDASPVSFFNFFLNTGAEQTSQELRLDGDTDRLKWVAGLYYLKLDINDNNGAISDPFVGPATTPGAEAGLLNPYTRELESYSGFGHLEYQLSDQWTLIGGLRLIKDENDFKYKTSIYDFLDPIAHDFDAASNLANRFTLASYEGDRNDDEWSGRVQLNWTPNDDLLVYTSLNRGVRGGGFNAPIFPLTPPLDYNDATFSYEPEKLDAVEVGFKGTYFDGRARVNGATYYYDYKDYQAFYIVGIDTITFNTDATSKGAELELIASPIDGMDLLLGGAYNDIDVELPSGDVPSVQSPKWMWNAMARYEWSALNGTLAVQSDWQYRSEHFFALTGAETVRENGYSIVNTSISYTDCNKQWTASAFVDNLLDEEYLVQTFDLSGPGVFDMTEQYYGRPRWWGVSLRYKWGA
ncbi:MAG: TonB-dependent receptor [Gammaproteobacteria bacterium]|nr:TonB-dependent receptor [Gammaproteobacteria bacterium]